MEMARSSSHLNSSAKPSQPSSMAWFASRSRCALCRHRHRAHLLRDAKYAIECGDTAFSAPFRWLLLRAIAIG